MQKIIIAIIISFVIGIGIGAGSIIIYLNFDDRSKQIESDFNKSQQRLIEIERYNQNIETFINRARSDNFRIKEELDGARELNIKLEYQIIRDKELLNSYRKQLDKYREGIESIEKSNESIVTGIDEAQAIINKYIKSE